MTPDFLNAHPVQFGGEGFQNTVNSRMSDLDVLSAFTAGDLAFKEISRCGVQSCPAEWAKSGIPYVREIPCIGIGITLLTIVIIVIIVIVGLGFGIRIRGEVRV